ncbi:polyketide synthase [Klebsiella aerogenes]|uniref:beta-ketoacyl [acyl carrier protein] synthase domain-containing protein n=1 Tax=Klebsiella aerogenes TaxID=548 RepID=UPI0019060386|nr:polyketide synthase [Klebsiella aerogenes]MBK0469564.1 polyketide synthase [Klebsiella aerogenes]HBU8525056.1 polyketide synthase [Klebsiella aerogenes]
MERKNVKRNPVAIIGMSCQFPGATDVYSFWELIKANKPVIGYPPETRKDLHIHARTLNIQVKGGYIENYEDFDASRFHIPESEYTMMDPQQKLVLTNVCNAIEDAGLSINELKGDRTGVFVGAMANDLAYLKFSDVAQSKTSTIIGNGLCMIANRVSYELDFGGPSMTIDSACSSALVALHQALHALHNDECDFALVAGVNIILSGLLQKFYSDVGVGAIDGHCKSFSSTASGIGRAEGVGVVLLQKLPSEGLSTITESNEYKVPRQIYAAINGSSVNNGGQSSRFTAPNTIAQIALLQRAYKDAQIGAEELRYIEGHGTGTRQGDFIEINALKSVFKDRTSPCFLGSVKSIIGHTEAASGMAGLIKIALMLYYNHIPPSLYADTPSDGLDTKSPVQLVSKACTLYEHTFRKHYMGVSSFGLGGTNAHIVLSSVAR